MSARGFFDDLVPDQIGDNTRDHCSIESVR